MEASLRTERAGTDAPEAEIPADSNPARNTHLSGRGSLPNLLIIGAQKCGTSGLHYYLGLHPEVSMSKPKELNFFIEERNWPRGADWYARHFSARATVRGEASPNYTACPQHMGVPERMAELLPDARLIYIVRDPLERIEAHWVHNYAKRREKGTLSETLMHPNTSYISRSQYFMQLQQFLKYFPDERVLVLDQHDLRNRRLETLRAVFEFVEVDPDFQHPSFEQERHRTARKKRATRLGSRIQKVSRTRMGRLIPRKAWLALDLALPLSKPIERPDVRDALDDEVLEVLRQDAQRLREYTGREFAHWSL